ncbi:cytochrome P450 [Mycena olivaceomarginata]|nr:cytochrome P450 [Mycena olivaceomarginata]
MLHALTLLDTAFILLGAFCARPGPRPWLGFLALPSITDKEWLTYGKWAEKWGDLTSVTAFGQTVVVVNSLKTAVEILDKKSTNYSDRPVGWTLGAVQLSARTPQFRWTRKQYHQLIGSPANVKKFHPIEVEEYRKFLQRLLESPERFRSHIHLTSGAIALRITYGYTVQGEDDPMIELVNDVMKEFSEAITPGAFLVDLLPIRKCSILDTVLCWMPGAGFQRKAKLWSDHRVEMLDKPFEFVEKQLAQGSAQDSFVSILLQQDLPEDEFTYLKWAAASLYGGAADTVATAQAELDAVVGNQRLPGYEDRERLPYIDALSKEVFRFHPITPDGQDRIALPHRAMEDDIHDSYLIPKGTWPTTQKSTPTQWYSTHPDSSLPTDTLRNPIQEIWCLDSDAASAQLVADASIFIACAMTLATFTISPAREVELVEDYQSGTIRGSHHPVKIWCSLIENLAIALIGHICHSGCSGKFFTFANVW